MANLGKLAIALLGVLAYQNRDKIGAMLKNAQQGGGPGPGGLLDGLSKGGAGTPIGELLDRIRNSGGGSKVDSWIGTGANEPIEPREVETAIDEETLSALSAQTGLSREELIKRISRDLPDVIDGLTPDGELPASDAQTGTHREPTLLDEVPLVGQANRAGM